MKRYPYLLVFAQIAWTFSCQDTRETAYPYTPLSFEVQQQGEFFLPSTLEVTLWAESPMLYNPTNIDIDEKGRVWVAEAVNYRSFNNDPDRRLDFPEGDRIVILSDTDRDGVADSSQVFVQDKDLVAPLGIAVMGQQVVVSCSPYLIVYTDENGDDLPDKKEILLEGFGGFDHDHSLHAVVGGPDGLWYFNTGNAGPHTVEDRSGWTLRSGSTYTGGSPYNRENEPNRRSDDQRVWVGGLALSLSPSGEDLRVRAHNFRNAYELALDAYGNMWQNDNDDQVQACRFTWLMEGGNAGYFSADGSRFWAADRRPGQDIFTAHWHQEDPGVLPACDNTLAGSPTGVAVYESDVLGPQYEGMLLSAEAGRNVIFAYQPQWKGAGVSLKRQDLLSTVTENTENYKWNEVFEDRRRWFRPSDIAVGTDGSLYIADWFDPIVGGHQMQDSTGYGRILRIKPQGEHPLPPSLDLSSLDGQVDALTNPAVNVRYQALMALKEQGATAVAPLQELLSHPKPYVQARALWALTMVDPSGIPAVKEVLRSHPDPRLRITAYRALKGKEAISTLAQLAVNDPAAGVRREVALSLRDLPAEQKEDLFLALCEYLPEQDPWYVEALGMGVAGQESEAYQWILDRFGEHGPKWPSPQADLVWRLHPPEAVPQLLERANAPTLPFSARIKALDALAFIPDQAAAMAVNRLALDGPKDLQDLAVWWLSFRAGNDWAPWSSQLSLPQNPVNKALEAARQTLLTRETSWPEKKKALQFLAGDSLGAQMLLQLSAGLPEGSQTQQMADSILLSHPRSDIRQMANHLLNQEQQASLDVTSAAARTGEASNGRQLFLRHCQACHTHQGQGGQIGPDLSGVHQKMDGPTLLQAIIAPSAGIAFGYEAVQLSTVDRQTYIGFLLGKGATWTLRDLAGQLHQLPATEVADQKPLGRSLMPDAAQMGLSPQDLADLRSFLTQPTP